MKLQKRIMADVISCVITSGALVGAVCPATAQTAAGEKIERVTVTGSALSRANRETPSPVQVLSADDLVKSGFTTVADVLNNITSNGQGALGQGFAGAFAGGASGIALRGLTVGATLVLIDGHRMAPFPTGDDAQRQFVDISSIPFDMVERIEVLKDGASSVYGSDAVAGVVNVILKKTYVGTAVGAEGGTTQHGGGKNAHATITHGFGDLAKDGYNAFASLEYRKSNAIKVSDRDNQQWAQGDWTSRGGINLNPGVPNVANGGRVAVNTPFLFNQKGAGGATNPANYSFLTSACDYTRYAAGQCAVRDTASNLQPETENLNLLVGFTKKLSDDWKLSLKGSAFRSEDKNNRGLPSRFPAGSFAGNTSLIPGATPQIVNAVPSFLVPANYPGNTFGSAARIYAYIPGLAPTNSSDYVATASRLAADLDGSYAGWDINASLGYTEVKSDIGYSGRVDRSALYAALIRPTNPFMATGGNSQTDLDAISPNFSNKASSKLSYAELRASRELMALAGGQLAMSTGISFVHKDINTPPPALLASGTVGNGAAYQFGKENNSAAFIEFVAPVLKSLEIDLSGRFDHFDTYGNSTTPKAGFKFTPIREITFRGTYSRGFRAPNAAETGTAGSFFSAGAVNDPILCANGDPKTKGNVVAACGVTPAYVQTTSKDLKPEKSTSATFGMILEPVKGWATTIDYYQVEIKEQINTASLLPTFVPNFVRSDILPTVIADGNGGTFIGNSSVGQIAYATSGYTNVGGVKTTGIELDTSYMFKLGEYGSLKTGLQVAHMFSYKLSFLGDTYQLAGTHGPSGVSGNTGNPKNRAQFTLGYDRGPLNVTTTFNWVGGYSALDPSVPDGNDCQTAAANVAGRNYFLGKTTPTRYCKIPSFMSANMTATYKLNNNWTLHGTVLNLFDREPPIDIATYGNAGNNLGYNGTLHSAGVVGRAFAVGANYKF